MAVQSTHNFWCKCRKLVSTSKVILYFMEALSAKLMVSTEFLDVLSIFWWAWRRLLSCFARCAYQILVLSCEILIRICWARVWILTFKLHVPTVLPTSKANADRCVYNASVPSDSPTSDNSILMTVWLVLIRFFFYWKESLNIYSNYNQWAIYNNEL